MKKISAIVFALLFFAASAMAQMTNRDYPFPVKPDTLKVLGLGNSFTDDGMEYLPDLLEAAGIRNVVLGRLYIGGCSLERHCHEYENSNNAYIYYKSGSDNKWTTVSKKAKSIDGLRDEDWDIVVIQQASGKSGLYDSYIPWLQRLNTILAEECPGAKVMWQQTWSYSSNSKHGEFKNYKCHTDTMHAYICRNVERFRKEGLIGDVIPSGPAIQLMRASEWCDENELTRDGFHMSHSAGRYTLACTWFESIIKPVFGKSVKNNSFFQTRKEELDPECAKACRKAAVKAVKEIRASRPAKMARVQPAAVFTDNMVLQRNADVPIWGKAEAGAQFTISASWSKEVKSVKADAEGNWKTTLATPDEGGPYEMTFDDGNRRTLRNILIGDVWICSGQSNMEMPVRGFTAQPVEHAAEMIVKAKPQRNIRIFNVSRKISLDPEYSCFGHWQEHTPEAVAECSATAYFFADMIEETTGVPVGLLIADWGGTPIQAWMSGDLLLEKFDGEMDLSYVKEKKERVKDRHHTPSGLYNGMLKPVMPYAAKGFLWYQGETNIGEPERYIRMQGEFVDMLRKDFNNPRMPFYYVQIAPYKYSNPKDTAAGLFMAAQADFLKTRNWVGMAPTLDLGELDCIHPCQKKQVGERLAMLALRNDYGVYTTVDVQCPTFKSVEFREGKAFVSFNDVSLALGPISAFQNRWLEVAGKDGVFHPAIGRPSWGNLNTLEVFSKEVPDPVAVRYAISNWSEAVFFNSAGLPVSPFMSDAPWYNK